MSKSRSKKVYFCGIDWDHEVGEIATTAYASENELKKRHSAWKGCGIVEIELAEAPVTWLAPYQPHVDAVSIDDAEKERLDWLTNEIQELEVFDLAKAPILKRRLEDLRLVLQHEKRKRARHESRND